jgi:hypothetical protein
LRDYFASARHCDPRQYYHNSCELAEISGSGTLASRLQVWRFRYSTYWRIPAAEAWKRASSFQMPGSPGK